MKIRIANLPADTSEDEIRDLLAGSDDVKSIDLIAEGDSESPVAVVEFSTDAAGEGLVQLINGRHWKGVTLRADKLLY